MPDRKLIVITGATRGLGRAMADAFVQLGHTVLGCGRSGKEIDRLRKQYVTPHDFYPVDVASDTAVKSWASLVLASHGVPDLILNNAGVINANARLWEIEAREFDGGPIPFKPPWPGEWAFRAPRNRGLPGYDDGQAMRLLTQGAIGREGQQLKPPMPRFHMSRQDAADVIVYMRSLH